MDFPQFENINENNTQAAHAYDNFADNNEIQIENMEFNNNHNPISQNQNANYNNSAWENTSVGEMNYSHSASNDRLDEGERKILVERKEEEEQRRDKIFKKMNDELRIKQEFRDKAAEYIENWRS
jgi:hypothetical protein